MQRWKLGRILALAPMALLGRCSVIGIPDSPLNSLDPKGPFARQIDNLFWPVFWAATAVFVLVEGAMVASFFFRDRPGRPEPRQIHGNNKLEIIWTIIPALILAGIAIPTVRSIVDLTSAAPTPTRWRSSVTNGGSNIATRRRHRDRERLVIPAGREVCATMTSDDVLHNYWIPALNGKRYLVPGQKTVLRLQADEPGDYWGNAQSSADFPTP